MTRPAFLLLTVVACALGTATAASGGFPIGGGVALAATVLAVLAHAAGNVLNDLHDARNGADAANTGGVYPFTGGSRLIQNGDTSERETAALVGALLWLLVPGGLWLAWNVGNVVIGFGLAGLLLVWAYSAPPLQLMSRGLGELAVALAWFLVVVGADLVQRRHWAVIPASVALGFAAMVAALLLINGVPDAAADARVGKRTLAVRLGPTGAWALYVGLTLGAHFWLVLSVWWRIPPAPALGGLVSLPLSLFAAGWLHRHRDRPGQLRPALAATVAATLLHGLGMAAGLAWMGWTP